MPQMMANAVPAAMPLMHGGSRSSVYKYPPMTVHQQQQQHAYQQTTQQQVPPPATVNSQPVLTAQFSAIIALVGQQEGHPACKKRVVGSMVVSLERGADLHMAQLMPLPLTVSCFCNIQIGFTFLVPAHPGSPGKRAVKRVCVFVCQCNHRLVGAFLQAVGAFLQATSRVPRWWIGERPPDMAASCDIYK